MEPQCRPRGGSIVLARSEIKALADALDPIIKSFPSRSVAARSIGLSDGTIAKFTKRPAALSISRTVVEDVGRATGIDVSRFGA